MKEPTKDRFSQMVDMVRKLRKNREGIPEREMPRYQKAMQRLMGRIMEAQKNVFADILLIGIYYEKNDISMKRCARKALNGLYEEYKEKVEQDAKEALLERCDIGLYVLSILGYQYEFLDRSRYIDYWLNHTRLLGGIYYNDLVDMWYVGGCWKDARGTFRDCLPPTLEACRVELIARREGTERDLRERFGQQKSTS